MIFSIVFLLSYISHHLLAGDTRFGDINHDNIVDPSELLAVGNTRMIYFVILITIFSWPPLSSPLFYLRLIVQ